MSPLIRSIGIALIIAIGLGIVLVALVGPVLITLKVPIATTFGNFCVDYGFVIGVLVGAAYFFAGGSWRRPAA